MVLIAFTVHLLMYIALGFAIVRLGGKYLPSPFNELTTTFPLLWRWGFCSLWGPCRTGVCSDTEFI
jgi:hypothetical protein